MADPTLTNETDTLTLQSLLLPEPAIPSDDTLYFRRRGDVKAEGQRLVLGPGAETRLDTYFNAFDIGEWSAACGLTSLQLAIAGRGRVLLRIEQARPGADKDITLLAREISLDAPVQADLSAALQDTAPGVLYVIVQAVTQTVLDRLDFLTRDKPAAWPRLALSITTFQREQAVAATAQRLAHFLETYEHRSRIFAQVVDNGHTANLNETPAIRRISNANLGGAGGFARGMIEARAAGATHCLFMDDDAAFHMESLRRTYALLALAKDPRTAVAGAMITTTFPHQMWENGAVFDGVCRPLHNQLDLRDRRNVFAMLFDATRNLPDNAYGGWWFFAFPLDHATHHPFPFFVRGDDSGFSLANRFHLRTLNGVVSFQDAFGEKENPLIHYLDTRYHLLHHLVFEQIDKGPLRTAWVPMRLLIRTISWFHYESAEAVLMAIRDVLSGPEFFLENADMQTRRADLKALTRQEAWVGMEAPEVRMKRRRLLPGILWVAVLNGHFIPFHARFGAQRVIPIALRGRLNPVWGAAGVTYFDAEKRLGYSVRQDTRRGLALFGKGLALTWRLVRSNRALKRAYRESYDDMTSEAMWRGLLDLDES